MITLNEVRNVCQSLFDSKLTVPQTTWGSRAGADASDSERMIRQDPKLDGQHNSDEKTYYVEKSHFTHDLTNTQALAA